MLYQPLLLVVQDNADLRLTPKGREAGVVGETRWSAFERRRSQIQVALERLDGMRLSSTQWGERGVTVAHDGVKRSVADVWGFPNTTNDFVMGIMQDQGQPLELDASSLPTVEVECRYRGYLRRQRREIAEMRESEVLPLPLDTNYEAIPSLSKVEVEILQAAKPSSVHAAARLQGIRPASLMVLFKYARRLLKDQDDERLARLQAQVGQQFVREEAEEDSANHANGSQGKDEADWSQEALATSLATEAVDTDATAEGAAAKGRRRPSWWFADHADDSAGGQGLMAALRTKSLDPERV